MDRERLGSRLGFLFLSAGCAIGVGNVWKFPWLTGQNGGGSFVLVYLLCAIIIGLPVMTMEFSMGRAAQTSPVGMYQKLQKQGGKWGFLGYIAMLANFCLMAFYTTVAGWILHYFIRFLTGNYLNIGFGAMITNPTVNLVYMAIVVVIGFFVLTFDLQGGLERVTKYLMGALFMLMIVLAVRSCFLPGAAAGLTFYLKPDFSKINGKVVVAALNQSFFSLSLGIGSMAIFGSYLAKDRALLSESASVVFLDTFIAIMAGLVIFPSCFTYGVQPDAGPQLLFDTMATVFVNMKGGRFWGALFFLFMVFAAMSTVFAVFENILANVREKTGWSRRKGSLVCGIVVFALSTTTALGYSLWTWEPFAAGSAWLDFWDVVVNYNLLPLGCFAMTLFCCNKFGWGWDCFLAEANTGKGWKVKNWMKPVFRYFAPTVILALYIYGMVTFSWN